MRGRRAAGLSGLPAGARGVKGEKWGCRFEPFADVALLGVVGILTGNSKLRKWCVVESKHLDHTLCICCIHVFSGERPILYISRDLASPPEYMCGQQDHLTSADGRAVGFGHLAWSDPSIISPGDVSERMVFERKSKSAKWRASTWEEF